MKKKFFLALLLSISGSYAHAGSVEFVTYYPAPYGIYDRLRLVPRAALSPPCDPGTMYVDDTTDTLRFCANDGTWGDIPDLLWTKVGSNLYPTDNTVYVGIGTTTPSEKVAVLNTADTADLVIGNTGFARSRIDLYNADFEAPAPEARIQSEPGTGGTNLTFHTETGGVLAERMRIHSNTFVGIGTSSPEFRLSIDNDGGIIAEGTFGPGTPLSSTGAGTRLIWYPRKAAFRAGSVNGTQWNGAGNYSVAMGYNPQANATHSVALGNSSTASGSYSAALGGGTASGPYATAIGLDATASADYSMAIGTNVAATGNNAIAMGYNTTAQALRSLVTGQWNIIDGNTSTEVDTDPLFVIGNGTSSAARSNALTVLKNGNVGIGPSAGPGWPNNKLHVTGGAVKATGGLIIQTSTTTPASPVDGQFWLCTDTGDATPCNGM